MNNAYKKLQFFLKKIPGKLKIYTHAWEGGNEDHDACNILVKKILNNSKKIDKSFQFSLYNAATNKFYYQVQKTLKINGRVITTQLQNKLADLLQKMGMDNNKKKLKELKAPMPGLVLAVMAKEGEAVIEGQELIVLEAMKMENAIKSPQDGTIDKIHVKKNHKIDKNHTLLSFQ